MPYLHTGSRPDTTARIYVRPAVEPAADATAVIPQSRPDDYRGRHRRPSRGLPRYATVAALLAIWATALVVGWDAMTGLVGR